eukprot:593645-Hanusia_phi.AAC.6
MRRQGGSGRVMGVMIWLGVWGGSGLGGVYRARHAGIHEVGILQMWWGYVKIIQGVEEIIQHLLK